MKIAHVVCTFPPYKGGMGNSAYQFAKVLALKGHNITVFTPEYGSKVELALNTAENKKEKGFKIKKLKPFFKYGNAAFIPQIFWNLSGFDVVHLHYPFFGAAEAVLLRKIISGMKMKLVVHYHMDTVSGGLKGLFFNLNKIFVLPGLMKYADAITCASLDYIENSDVSVHLKRYKYKFYETLFGVDLEKFKPNEDENKEKTSKSKYILFVGGLDKAHYFKGLDVLINAFGIIAKDLNDVYLSVIGSGDMEEYYKKMAKKLGVSDKVKFFGSVASAGLENYINNSDLLVLPSINKGEAFGLVLLEAMACSKPIIASNLPGVRRVFNEGEQGMLVKPGDVNDLAEKMRVILSDDDLAEKMGIAGRKFAEEKYSWSKVGERLGEVYNHYSICHSERSEESLKR